MYYKVIPINKQKKRSLYFVAKSIGGYVQNLGKKDGYKAILH